MKRFWIVLFGLIFISGLVFAHSPAENKNKSSRDYDANFIGAGLGTSGTIIELGFKFVKDSSIGFKTYYLCVSGTDSSDSSFLGLEVNLWVHPINEKSYMVMGLGKGRILKGWSKIEDDDFYLMYDFGIRLLKKDKNSLWLDFGIKHRGPLLVVPHVSLIARINL